MAVGTVSSPAVTLLNTKVPKTNGQQPSWWSSRVARLKVQAASRMCFVLRNGGGNGMDVNVASSAQRSSLVALAGLTRKEQFRRRRCRGADLGTL